MTLGELIKQYRTKHNMNMRTFSQLSGLSRAYISMLERNLNPTTGKPIAPSIDAIKKAADAMDLEFNSVFNMIDGDIIVSSKKTSTKNSSIDSPNADMVNLTPHEQSILATYRAQPETQHAIDYILEKPEHCKFVNQYTLLDERDQDRITERMETLLEDKKYSSKAKASLA